MLRNVVLILIYCYMVSARMAVAGEDTSYLTEQQILRMSPKASPTIVRTLIQSQEELRAAGIVPQLRIEHFLAQILTETGGLRRLDEDMATYSVARLQAVFKVPADVAQDLAGHPRETANYVYGGRLGNYGRGTDDGWNYRGSGYIQLTGRYNFRQRGLEIGQPLENTPELARAPRAGLLAAIAYWTVLDVNTAADSDNLRSVRARVNPLLEGYEASRIWRQRVQVVMSGSGRLESEPLSGEQQTVVQDDPSGVLRELGFLGGIEATTPTEVAGALRAFQKSRSLPETGRVDEDTLYSLTDPSEWKGRVPQPVDLNNASSPSRRAGISYDLKSNLAHALSSGGAESRKSESHGQRGTGLQQSTPTLNEPELFKLNNSAPFFAPYERQSGLKDAQNTFVPFSVIEPDTRKVITNTTELPTSAIVQISFRRSSGSERYACTGALISRDVVLTAGHCVHDGGPTGSWHQDYIVVPARNGPVAPFGTCSATKLFSVTGWVEADTPDEGRLDDIGAIKLDCDIGSRTGILAFGTLADSPVPIPEKIYGYPADKAPTGKQWESDGEVELFTASKLFYHNSTYGGMSGSPVLADTEAKIIAVHTNGLHGGPPWNSYNAATRLSDDIIRGLTEFIKE